MYALALDIVYKMGIVYTLPLSVKYIYAYAVKSDTDSTRALLCVRSIAGLPDLVDN